MSETVASETVANCRVRKRRVQFAIALYPVSMILLDAETCYRALQARDPRFDGRFFTAVRTTQIFCRPVCPARTPKFENCRFFSSAAAAHAAGFRPCLRCRPELSPDLLTQITTASTVNRALRLINQGALDQGSVAELASRLGMGDRHLRRLFDQHLGISPLAVAQTRRILFAKQLINQTGLPLTDIALAAGFNSIRRFNTAMRDTYQKSPTELRQAKTSRLSTMQPLDPPAIQIRLPFEPPYDWAALVQWLTPRVTAGVEQITPALYRRTIELEGTQGRVELRPAENANYLLAQIQFPRLVCLSQIVERLRQMFDLSANIGEIAAHLGADPHLQPVVNALPGLRLPGAWDGFELAVRTILGQQVSVTAATKMAGRLVQTYGAALAEPQGELTHLFPQPVALAAADLTQIGLTQSRSKAINAMAAQFAAEPDFFSRFTDLEDAVQQLTQLPGVGDWTAQYIAMRALREPDAFPASDLGLRRSMALLGYAVQQSELVAVSQAWRPWRAYAAMYLWSYLNL